MPREWRIIALLVGIVTLMVLYDSWVYKLLFLFLYSGPLPGV